MLYEYMQRRSKLNNEQFQKVVEQSNSEDMVTQFKTIFQVAEEKALSKGITKGRDEAICFAIKGFINKTRLGDAIIADTLDVSLELVKTIRAEVKAEKMAAAKKVPKAATPKKAAKPKTKKP